MFMKWWMGNSSNPRREGLTGSVPAARRRAAVMKSAAAGAMCVSLVLTSGCGLLPKESQEEVLPAITAPSISKKPEYEVTTATLETKVQANGKLLSTQEETMYFTLDGKRLKTLDVKPGQKVTAGQMIGSLEIDDMKKDLRQKKLQFRKAETSMKETLRNRDEMDPVDFEEASIAFEEQRQAIVDAETDIAKAVITAPFAGTIVSLHVQKGDLIQAYDPICIVADTSHLVVAASMTKDDLSKIAMGMPAVVNINNAGEFEGKVKQLPVTTDDDQNGGGGQSGGNTKPERPEDFLLVDIGKMPADLTRGTPLSVNIIIKRKENAIVIPLAALRTIGARTYVQVVDEAGKREVDVAVGQQTATQAEILEGLTPGQKVVGR